MLGVRDTVDDCLIPLRNRFDMSEFVELLKFRYEISVIRNKIYNPQSRGQLTNLRLLLNFICCSKLSTCFWRANTCRLAVSDLLFLSRFEQCSSIADLWCWKYGPVSSNDAPCRLASRACKCVRPAPDVLARWRGLFPLAIDDRWCVCVRCVGDIELRSPIDEHVVKFGTEPLRETRRSSGKRRGELRRKEKEWMKKKKKHLLSHSDYYIYATYQSIFEKWTNAAVWALLDCVLSPGDVLNTPNWLSQRLVCDPTACVDDITAAMKSTDEKKNETTKQMKLCSWIVKSTSTNK